MTPRLRACLAATVLAFAAPIAAPALAYDAKSATADYDTYCAQCHGLARNGKGVNAVSLSVQPRDHTDARSMGDMSDEHIATAIRGGGLAINKSALMPGWKGVLSEAQIADLVRYLRAVCKCGPKK